MLAATIAEDITGALGRSGAGGKSGFEPGVLVGRMVGHDVDDDLDAVRVSRSDHVIEVVKRAETWVDIAVVRHIIAAINKRRWVKRAQPDGLDTQPLKIVHLLGNARDIAQTRTSRILKRARVDLINRGIGHPWARRGLFCSHGMSLPCNEVLRDAHDDTPKADIRGKQRHSHAPNARSLSGSSLLERIDRSVKRTEGPLLRPRQQAGSGCPKLPRKRREAYFMYATDD